MDTFLGGDSGYNYASVLYKCRKQKAQQRDNGIYRIGVGKHGLRLK